MAGVLDPQASELLARLYRGIGEDPPWQGFLEALAGWMEATYATLIIATPGKPQPATFLTPGGDTAFADAYSATLFADDPFKGLPDGRVTAYAEFMATLPGAAYAEYRRAMGEAGFDQVLGVDLGFASGAGGHGADRKGTDRGRFEARFRVSRHRTLPDFTRADRARLQSLVPHLRIAVGLFEKLQFAGAEHGVFHSAAQGLGLALVVLDRNRRVVSTNPLADELLAEGEGVIRRGDLLVLADPAQQRLVGDLLAGSTPLPRLPRFRIERPGHGDLIATARPLNVNAIHAGAGALALFLTRAAAEPESDPDSLRDLFALTPAEARLAAALADGQGLVEAARSLGITRSTAKTQLRAIFAKTGVHRQTQLVALLSSVSA